MVGKSCKACRGGAAFPIPISMAFQPIVSCNTQRVFAYEALLRGADGASAAEVFDHVTEETLYPFDQACRTRAIEVASELDLARDGALLSINFLPNAVYNPRACIRVTLDTVAKTGFPLQNIVFEFTETERVDPAHLIDILQHYRTLGFRTAIDDFGSGYAGLGLLADYVPDIVKIDMMLVRGCDTDRVRQSMLSHMVPMLRDLDVVVVCEGIETIGEFETLRARGVDLMQGYLFARPAFEALPKPVWPESLIAAQAPTDSA